ncbi:hypothetical protein ABER99_21225 [Paenibacillus glucanolyticus]|jgi:hypothetical protein|uniref:Helix-turn-helix conjugative transposon-like domain-containing protein n=1 Tax=Paenibacillus glucanolyticus TaxID=59843 RepID=A0A163G841_9BACL|nr:MULTISPECIES: hypothetical protein [Paenibacillus]KZS44786.1 hypothetical protein AWU65_01990 [Paenibacillus glucanolyticus]MDH6675689.1 hypothetical protein [Paenibacillus sp. LBL]OMF64451.1 hypothetical protein BK142_31880 [Paenibacillus glucanolyticus]
MEKENVKKIITDHEFLELLQAAKNNDHESILALIDLFKKDILSISRYIHLPKEDAISEITLEILEFIKRSDDEII